jgi:hypothetical protein
MFEEPILNYWLISSLLVGFFLINTFLEVINGQRDHQDFVKLYLILIFVGLIFQILTWPFLPFLRLWVIPLELSSAIVFLFFLRVKYFEF